MAGRRLALSLARSGAVRLSNPTQQLAPSVSSARKALCALPSCPLPSHHVLLSPAHQRQPEHVRAKFPILVTLSNYAIDTFF